MLIRRWQCVGKASGSPRTHLYNGWTDDLCNELHMSSVEISPDGDGLQGQIPNERMVEVWWRVRSRPLFHTLRTGFGPYSLFTSFFRPSASSATAFLFSLYPKRRITSCSSVEEHEIKEFLSRSKWFELRGISVPLYQLCEVRGIGSASR